MIGANMAGVRRFRLRPRVGGQGAARIEDPMPNSRSFNVKSAARVLDLLEALASGRPQSFAELSDRLAIPKSSLFHLLNTLAARGYVEQAREPHRAYQLGPSVADLSQLGARPDTMSDGIRLLVRELSTALDAVAAYYELRGDYSELVVARSSQHARQIEIPLSRLAPLYPTSWGKVLLAHGSDAEIDAYIARTAFKPFTPRTIVSGEALWREIEAIRREGYAISNGEYATGWTGRAVCLSEGGRVLGAIGVVVSTERCDEAYEREMLRLLAATVTSFGAWPRTMPAGEEVTDFPKISLRAPKRS